MHLMHGTTFETDGARGFHHPLDLRGPRGWPGAVRKPGIGAHMTLAVLSIA
jgi:hypothetical protein